MLLCRASGQTVTYPNCSVTSVNVTVSGLLQSSTSKTGHTSTFAYDALGRQTAVTDARTGTSQTHYNALGQVDYVEDAAANRTAFVYDADTGRRTNVIDALTNATYTAYDPEGRVTNTWGATYPVAYVYDDVGRMVSMRTYRVAGGAGDETRWLLRRGHRAVDQQGLCGWSRAVIHIFAGRPTRPPHLGTRRHNGLCL